MFKKIVLSLVLVCLFIAIPLALMGYKKVELGEPFLAFMQNVSKELNDFKIAIPDIPSIPHFEGATDGGFLEVMSNILNALINFVNVIITVLNALSTIINIIIQLLQTIFIVIKQLIGFKDNVAANNSVQSSSISFIPIL